MTQSLDRLIKIGKDYSKNISSHVNFNKYGEKDNLPLNPVSPIFIDTFIVRYILDDVEEVDLKMKSIRLFFSHYISDKTATIIPSVHHNIKTNLKYIDTRINCPDEPIDDLLNLLQSKEFIDNRFILTTLDITQDSSGSFDLGETVRYYETQYSLQSSQHSTLPYIIPEMLNKSGPNCFAYQFEGMRIKHYLKFPQMLQTRRVREEIGQRWYDWVQSKSENFNRSVLESSDRGLTRTEITLYNDDITLDKDEIVKLIEEALSRLSPSLIYKTSHANMWCAYADSFQHSLIVTNNDVAILVYSYDDITDKLSGCVIKDWIAKEERVLSYFTFSSDLPIDIIQVSDGVGDEDGSTHLVLRTQYRKHLKRKFSDVTMFADCSGRFKYTKKDIDLSVYGFVNHPNCNMAVTNKRIFAKSLMPISNLQTVGEKQSIFYIPFTSKRNMDALLPIISDSKPDKQCVQLTEYSFSYLNTLPLKRLCTLSRGKYSIIAIVRHLKELPKLVISVNNQAFLMYCNKQLSDSLPNDLTFNSAIYCKEGSPFAELIVRYHAKRGRKVTSYCSIVFT